MNSTENDITRSSANYKIIIPISMFCALFSIIISCGILILIRLKKRLHTIGHILICNTCISSIYYSLVQSINYLHLIFIPWDKSDISCRCRAYFGYMSIASIVYSYFIQALSRYFFSKFHTNHRWILSFKFHYIILLVQWIILLIIPLPSLLTNDIYYRPTFLCWVPKTKLLHSIYTMFAYYLVPVIFIIYIYLNIYRRVKSSEKISIESIRKMKENRNLDILRNILILISIYTFGATPTLIYITTRIEIFYSIGIIFLPLFVSIEKLLSILLDREIRIIIKNYFSQSTIKITPIIINYRRHIIQPNL